MAREVPYAAVSFCCLGMRWGGGHRAEWVREEIVGDREPPATEHHGCVRAFNGYRPPSRLEKGGRNAAGTWCILALCLTRCVMYKSSDRIRTHLARFAKIAE